MRSNVPPYLVLPVLRRSTVDPIRYVSTRASDASDLTGETRASHKKGALQEAKSLNSVLPKNEQVDPIELSNIYDSVWAAVRSSKARRHAFGEHASFSVGAALRNC